MIFVNHHEPETEISNVLDRDFNPNSSKKKMFEAQMTLQCVRYLGQQGYGTDKIVGLTQYCTLVNYVCSLTNYASQLTRYWTIWILMILWPLVWCPRRLLAYKSRESVYQQSVRFQRIHTMPSHFITLLHWLSQTRSARAAWINSWNSKHTKMSAGWAWETSTTW